MRKKIYEIIKVSGRSSLWSILYDYFMIFAIAASLLPLAFKQDYPIFDVIDKIAITIFIIDYLLRFYTADFLYGKKSVSSFLRYPFSFMAIIDILSILPFIALLSDSFRLLRVFRLVRSFQVFRVFKVLRYSKSYKIIVSVFKRQKDSLLAVLTFAFAYILISALIIYDVEPDTFDTFFSAVYWATVSLTTLGYGDISPVTVVGRIVTMVSTIFGVAVIALPSGIITAGYMQEIGKKNAAQKDKPEIGQQNADSKGKPE
ncbi:MAG: ion transporter [Bacillota bacterium]